MEQLYLLRSNPHARQFIKFALVGASSTAINLLIYALLLTFGLYYLLASAIAFMVATANGYTFNRTWTFRSGAHQTSRLAKFIIIQVVGLGVNLTILAWLVEMADLNKLLAQLVASILVAAVTFSGNKLWTFKP